MTYLETHDRSNKVKARLATALAILIVIIVLIQGLFPQFLPAIFTTIAKPFWRAEFSIESGSLRTPGSLLSENEALKRQIYEAEASQLSVKEIQDENAELKALMGRASTTPFILAAVLKRPPLTGYDELVVDAGSDHSFVVGDLVYVAGDVPIGRISEVLGDTSIVTLFSSPGQRYEVMFGPDHIYGTAIGRGGGQYEAQLPRDSGIASGDYVVLPMLNSKPFGIVSSVVIDPSQPFEMVLFSPPVNIFESRWVMVDARKK